MAWWLSTGHCQLLSWFIGLNFQSRSKAAWKVLGKLEIRLVRWWRGLLGNHCRCSSVPAKRQTTMRVDNGGIVAVHRSTLSTLWGGGEAIKGSCASRPIHLNSRERGDGSLFISTTHQRGRGPRFIQGCFLPASTVQYQNEKSSSQPELLFHKILHQREFLDGLFFI